MVRYITDDEEELRTLRESPPTAYLVLLVQGKAGQSFPLRQEIELGRERGNTVVVADRKVSRRHARLTPIDDTFILSDLGSANGTYVNGVLIGQPTRLKHNDRFVIGDTTFLYTITPPNPQDVYTPPVPSPAASPRAGNYSPNLLPLDSGQARFWLVIGCLALVIVSLLIVLALLFGLFIGRSAFLGLVPGLLASVS